jgi:hypothetical protein
MSLAEAVEEHIRWLGGFSQALLDYFGDSDDEEIARLPAEAYERREALREALEEN